LINIENYDFVHVLRELNAEADALANQAKDLPNYTINLKL